MTHIDRLVPRVLRRCLLLGILCMVALVSFNLQAVERVTYYHNDALGSPVAATDKDGKLLWREEYAPYGERLLKQDAGTNSLWYTGKQEESAFAINYVGARWYDPRMGRFMAVDRAGFSDDNIQSFNRYAYANNNPYKYLDPDGNSPLDVGFFVVDAIRFGLALYSGNAAAIQSTGRDLLASTIGLASPIPGTGQAIKLAKAGEEAAGVVRAVGRGVEGGSFVAKSGVGIWKSSRIDAAKAEHIFSRDHIRTRIMDLGNSKDAILQGARDRLMKADQSGSLRDGWQTVITNMNGHDASINVFFKNGEMQSFDIFKGISNREGRHVIDLR